MLASVCEWSTNFSSAVGGMCVANLRESSSMKSAAVTALRFHFSVTAISFSLTCAWGEHNREGCDNLWCSTAFRYPPPPSPPMYKDLSAPLASIYAYQWRGGAVVVEAESAK